MHVIVSMLAVRIPLWPSSTPDHRRNAKGPERKLLRGAAAARPRRARRIRQTADVLTRHAAAPDLVLRYGPADEHVADLRLTGARERAGDTPLAAKPLVIFLHGGFWRVAFDRAHTGPLAAALADEGFAVCTPEYRRTGQPGGGWPGTLDDIAAAVDLLPGLAAEAAGGMIDPGQTVLAGHSAGGHLALWAAGRLRLPAGSPWRSGPPQAVGVVGLAAVCDLAACYEQNLGDGAAAALTGGSPADYPDRYASADPVAMLPAGVPARLVHGTADDRVPCQMSLDYVKQARLAGDEADCEVLPGSGHFAMIDPPSAVWPRVVAAFGAMTTGAGRPGSRPADPDRS
jgi:acetyl esterase/lipase